MSSTRWLFGGELFAKVDAGRNPVDLLRSTGGMYRVGMGRWFGADSNGLLTSTDHVTTTEEPGHVVLCDFNANPLPVDGNLMVLPVARSRFGRPVKTSRIHFNEDESRTVLYLSPASSFRPEGQLLALDDPAHGPTAYEDSSTWSWSTGRNILPERYECGTGSLRATVMAHEDDRVEFVALVGSKYTVLQNTILAEDAWELLHRALAAQPGAEENVSRRQKRVRGGGDNSFFGISVGLNLAALDLGSDSFGLSVDLSLYHSHDTRYTYTNLWAVRDLLVEEQPIMGTGKIKIKHTKNIGDRVDRVSRTLGEVQQEISSFIDGRSLMERCPVPNHAADLENLVGQIYPVGHQGWLVKRVIGVFNSDNYLGRHGPTSWTLYRAICAVEGGYWDSRTEVDGLPSLLKVKDAYGRRNMALKHLVGRAQEAL